MAFCNKCGASIPEGASFCNACGTPVVNEESSNQQTNEQNFSKNQNNSSQQDNSGPSFHSSGAQNSFNNAMNFVNNTEDSTSQFNSDDILQNKGIAAISYLGILFFIPLVAKPESKFARYHSNQGLCLLIFGVILNIINGIIGTIIKSIFVSEYVIFGYTQPSGIAYLLTGILSLLIAVICLVFVITGFMNALNGKAKELPLIGKFKLIK